MNSFMYQCRDLQLVLDKGIKSIAVILKHAAIYPDHEEAVGKLAKKMGFEQARHQLPAYSDAHCALLLKYIKKCHRT